MTFTRDQVERLAKLAGFYRMPLNIRELERFAELVAADANRAAIAELKGLIRLYGTACYHDGCDGTGKTAKDAAAIEARIHAVLDAL